MIQGEKHRADERTEGGKRRGDGRLGERWSDGGGREQKEGHVERSGEGQ